MARKTPNLAGQTFGGWTVTHPAERSASGAMVWWCTCVCGTKKTVLANALRQGKSTNCGCLQRAAMSARKRTHGMTDSQPWNSWMAMRKRCRDPNNIGWANYGGRGIRVCQEWDESFEAFWRDMGPTYQPGLTIERKDVNGHYEPGNCEWIPLAEQLRNRRPFEEWRNGYMTDLVGQTFGKWTVLRPTSKQYPGGSPSWLCRCSCGTERPVPQNSLQLGKSRSCGCRRRSDGPSP